MMVRMPIAEYLRDCGYNVLEAADASEAIATMRAERSVSLVFSDIRMPGKMDGFGLAEWFQSHYPVGAGLADLGIQRRPQSARRPDVAHPLHREACTRRRRLPGKSLHCLTHKSWCGRSPPSLRHLARL